jgi:hypothetical protein
MDRLVSKIFAGGLSAGVFLLWWPEHVHGEGLLQLVLRGLLWTLTFELLLLAFGPAEVLIARRLRERVTHRRERVKDRLAGVPAPARTGGVVVLACCGLAGPLALLADAPRELVRQVDDKPRVVKQVIVERPVVEKKIVVRRVVAPASAGLLPAGAAPSVPAAQVARPAARKAKVAAERTAAKPAPAPRTTSTASAPAQQTAPDASATAPAPDSGSGSGAPAATQPASSPAAPAAAPAP